MAYEPDDGPIPTRAYTRENYAPPWRVEINPGMSRARIVDANDCQIAGGINITKARVIVAAVNRDARAK